MLKLKHICIIILGLSIPGNPALCDHFYQGSYPVGQDPWYYCFKDLASAATFFGTYGLFLYARESNDDKLGKLIATIAMGYALTDVIEKWIFKDRTSFTINDMYGMLIVAFFAYYEQIVHPLIQSIWPFYKKITTHASKRSKEN